MTLAAALGIAALFLAACVHYAEIDPLRLWHGLPKLAHWAATAWPPDFSDIDTLLFRAAQTVAMATIGTLLGIVLAAPLCLLAARNVTPLPGAWHLARGLLDMLRGVDSFVFALLFVAAVDEPNSDLQFKYRNDRDEGMDGSSRVAHILWPYPCH